MLCKTSVEWVMSIKTLLYPGDMEMVTLCNYRSISSDFTTLCLPIDLLHLCNVPDGLNNNYVGVSTGVHQSPIKWLFTC